MERHTQFMLLMILVLVLIIVLTYNSAFGCKKTRNPDEEFADETVDTNTLLTRRVSSAIYVMHELTTNRIVNRGDVNSMYPIWQSTMNKRGFPSFYVTPELFTELRTQTVRGDMSPESVEAAILPYYQREVDMLRNPPTAKPFEPVCLNY